MFAVIGSQDSSSFYNVKSCYLCPALLSVDSVVMDCTASVSRPCRHGPALVAIAVAMRSFEVDVVRRRLIFQCVSATGSGRSVLYVRLSVSSE